MQLKNSFFNKTLIKKNQTRFWPIPVLYTVFMLFACCWNLYIMLSERYITYSDETVSYMERRMNSYVDVIWNFSSVNTMCIFLISILVAAVMFSYLYQSKSANMMHAFPVTRSMLFASNYVSGLLMILLPQVINAVVVFFLTVAYVPGYAWVPGAYILISAAQTIFFYSFAVFVCMFTGQFVTAIFFYFVWNLLYPVCVTLMDAFSRIFFFGVQLNLDYTSPLMPIGYMIRNVGFIQKRYMLQDRHLELTGEVQAVVYALIGVLFAFAAFKLYERRQIEHAGEFITISWVKKLFRFGASVVLGSFLAFFLLEISYSNIWYQRTYGSYVIFEILLTITVWVVSMIAEMLIQKNFRVWNKKVMLSGLVCGLCCVAVSISFQYDLFGVEKYVPDYTKLEKAKVTLDGETAVWNDPETLLELTKLHQELIGYKTDIMNGGYGNLFVDISYYGEKGDVVSRSYQISYTGQEVYTDTIKRIAAFHNDSEARIKSILGEYYKEQEFWITSANLSYSYLNQSGEIEWADQMLPLTNEQAAAIWDALMYDIEQGNLLKNDDRLRVYEEELEESEKIELSAQLFVDIASREDYPACHRIENDSEYSTQLYFELNEDAKDTLQQILNTGIEIKGTNQILQ